jgi:hypothetical protein
MLSKGNKVVKSHKLSNPAGVADVQVGHAAVEHRMAGHHGKSAPVVDDNDADDVKARKQRWLRPFA